jgi:hypothetical protein
MHSDKYIQALVDSQSFFEIHQENVLGVNMDVLKIDLDHWSILLSCLQVMAKNLI